MRKLLLLTSVLFVVLLFPAVVSAQDGLPTKQPPAPVATEEAAPTEATMDGSPAQLYADVRPQLGMELLAASHAPDFFEGTTIAGGDKFVAVGGGCASGYTGRVASLGMAWVSDSGPVDITFTPDDAGDQAAFLIWEVYSEYWWCSTGFFDRPVYDFNNLGTGIFLIWLLTPNPDVVSGTLTITAAG